LGNSLADTQHAQATDQPVKEPGEGLSVEATELSVGEISVCVQTQPEAVENILVGLTVEDSEQHAGEFIQKSLQMYIFFY
jgi:hypothetical protein